MRGGVSSGIMAQKRVGQSRQLQDCFSDRCYFSGTPACDKTLAFDRKALSEFQHLSVPRGLAQAQEATSPMLPNRSLSLPHSALSEPPEASAENVYGVVGVGMSGLLLHWEGSEVSQREMG